MAPLWIVKIFLEIGLCFDIIYLNLKFSAKFTLKWGIVSVYLKNINFWRFCDMEKGTIMNFLNFLKMLNFWQDFNSAINFDEK